MTPELLALLTPERQTLQLDRYNFEPPAGDIIGDLLLELAKAKQAWAADRAELAGELREISASIPNEGGGCAARALDAIVARLEGKCTTK